ncbi:hypothetical protein [Micromonospora sp. WMMD812]|nr:hypothetical protein [Micromonospora sp. WMMD812]WBB67664.1 hypothetical protein O7603_32095 [Micromonospora sp. WMMD812]
MTGITTNEAGGGRSSHQTDMSDERADAAEIEVLSPGSPGRKW